MMTHQSSQQIQTANLLECDAISDAIAITNLLQYLENPPWKNPPRGIWDARLVGYVGGRASKSRPDHAYKNDQHSGAIFLKLHTHGSLACNLQHLQV